jgi:hypothetical protein
MVQPLLKIFMPPHARNFLPPSQAVNAMMRSVTNQFAVHSTISSAGHVEERPYQTKMRMVVPAASTQNASLTSEGSDGD